jgi:hypothetical protein
MARQQLKVKSSPELALYATGGLKDGVFHVWCG